MSSLLLHPAVVIAFVYLVVTLLFQFRPFTTRAQALDVLGIIPRWKFFIPQANRLEVAIELRGGNDEASLGGWSRVRIFPPRRVVHWLWSPDLHRSTIVWLSAHRVAVRGDHGAAYDTLAYQTLIRHLRDAALAQRHARFQFALVHPDRHSDDPERALFVSQLHAP